MRVRRPTVMSLSNALEAATKGAVCLAVPFLAGYACLGAADVAPVTSVTAALVGVAAYRAAMLMASAALPRLAARRAQPALFVACVVAAIALIAFAVKPAALLYFFAQVAFGCIEPLRSAVQRAIVSDARPPGERGRAHAQRITVGLTASVCGAVVAPVIAGVTTPAVVFAVSAGLLAVSGALLALLPRPAATHRRHTAPSFAGQARVYVRYAIVAALFGALYGQLTGTIAVRGYAVHAMVGPALVFGLHEALELLQPWVRPLLSRWPSRYVAPIGFVVMASAFLRMGWSESLIPFVLGVIGFVIGETLVFARMEDEVLASAGRAQPAVALAFSSALHVGAFLGATAAAMWASDIQPPTASVYWLGLAVAAIICASLAFALLPPEKKQATAGAAPAGA